MIPAYPGIRDFRFELQDGHTYTPGGKTNLGLSASRLTVLLRTGLRFQQAREFRRAVVKTGEHGMKIAAAEMPANYFAEDRSEIGRQREIAALIQLPWTESRPLAVYFSALHRAAHHEHAIVMAMIGATISVFVRGAAEFGHGHDHHVLHAVAQILMQRRQALPQFAQQ